MKKFDIDSTDHGLMIPSRRKGKKFNVRIHIGRFGKNHPGVSAQKLINWRLIEKRYSQLSKRSKEAWCELFDEMKKLAPSASRDKEAWFLIDDNSILQYSGDGYSLARSDERIKGLLGKNSNEKFILIGRDKSEKISKLQHKAHRFNWAEAVYRQAFRYSVENRLREVAESRLGRSGITPFTILLKNDDRTYAITCEGYGDFNWNPEEILEVE